VFAPAKIGAIFFAENQGQNRDAGIEMGYVFFGDELGGRPRDPSLYCDGVADYEAMAQRPGFRADLDRLLAMAGQRRLCLMCSERDPLDCHRCLLVARALAACGATSAMASTPASRNSAIKRSSGILE
jgi:hypothetical protein